ncbi:hypothetical protein [Aquicoccus sp. SU-CL01552]|uniref:hypothetical protein n=1 Tax=Aquicoccus sp. SU-CL01552 TaxID=3127656 RepID=UPI00310358E0
MKKALIGLALVLTACTEMSAGPAVSRADTVRQATVWGRGWTVTQPVPGLFKAVRDDNDLDPFGPPARLRTHQAIRAFHAATGCKAIYSTMYQTISGEFFTQLDCP